MSIKHEIFASPMWGFTAPEQWRDYIRQLELHCLSLSASQPSVKKSNFIGWQSTDYMHKEPEFKILADYIVHVANKEILPEFMHNNPNPFTIDAMWVNVNGPGAFNMAHIHDGDISGAFYIKVPQGDSGRFVVIDPRQRVSGSSHRVHVSNFPVTPQRGACIMFPSWLEHYVEPNQTQESRISISFNLK